MSMKIVSAIAALVVLAFLAGRLGIGSAPSEPPASPPQQALVAPSSPIGSALVVEVLPVTNPVESKLNLVLPEVTFSKTSFAEAIETLRTNGNINVMVDWRSLEAEGISGDVPITLALKDVALGDALKMVLMAASTPTASLGYEPSGTVLIIATEPSLSRSLVLRVYDVADIVLAEQERQRALYPEHAKRKSPGAIVGTSQQQLRQTNEEILEDITRLIQENIAPDTWRETGGMIGSIRELSGRLIIEQTRANQLRTEAMLSALRATGRIPTTRPAHP